MCKQLAKLPVCILFFLVYIALIICNGCSSLGASNANSLTGGISLEMSIKGKENLATIYKVEQDGTIHFGGGLDAQLNKTSWTGQLTEQEATQLIALLNKQGWFSDLPYSSNFDADREYKIKLRWIGAGRTPQ